MAGKGKPVDLAKELGKIAVAVADSLFGEDEVAEDDESVRSLRTARRGDSAAAVLTIPFCEVVWTPRDEMTEAMARAFNAMLDTIPDGPDADEMSEETHAIAKRMGYDDVERIPNSILLTILEEAGDDYRHDVLCQIEECAGWNDEELRIGVKAKPAKGGGLSVELVMALKGDGVVKPKRHRIASATLPDSPTRNDIRTLKAGFVEAVSTPPELRNTLG